MSTDIQCIPQFDERIFPEKNIFSIFVAGKINYCNFDFPKK